MDDPLTPELARTVGILQIADRFGWTMEYVESLDDFVYTDILGYLDGMAQIERHEAIKAKNKAKV